MTTLALQSLYRDCSRRWLSSAKLWRAMAEAQLKNGDFAHACFAHLRAVMCELHAAEDEKKAEACE